jgi:surface antigen
MRKWVLGLFILIIISSGAVLAFERHGHKCREAESTIVDADVGLELDSHKGVKVFNNGKDYVRDYGKSYSKDGYYYGLKWQCVEFIKRFYYEAKGHKMPDVYGHAKDFFDETVEQGQINKKRALLQYKNGDNVKPLEDDLLVFTDTKYGHVAIITEVTDRDIEFIQQNIYGITRDRLKLSVKDGKYTLGGGDQRIPAGWLRKGE